VTLTIVLGGLGAGKTLFTTIMGCHEQVRPVYANYHIRCPKFAEFDLHTFLRGEYANCIIILDEAYVYLESRSSGRLLNKVLSYVLFQSRKMGMDIILTAQLNSSLDVRFRELVDFVVRCRASSDGFHYTITFLATNHTKQFFLPTPCARTYFPKYDTMERVEPVEEMDKVLEITTSPQQKLKDAESFAVQVLDTIEAEFGPGQRPTHALVDFYCQQMETPAYLWEMVYVVCQKLHKQRSG
jgi:hypothetical protein